MYIRLGILVVRLHSYFYLWLNKNNQLFTIADPAAPFRLRLHYAAGSEININNVVKQNIFFYSLTLYSNENTFRRKILSCGFRNIHRKSNSLPFKTRS
jgi:hypothetical protein